MYFDSAPNPAIIPIKYNHLYFSSFKNLPITIIQPTMQPNRIDQYAKILILMKNISTF